MHSIFQRQARPAEKRTTAKESTQSIVPWVEKYRPRKVEDVAFQDEVVLVLKKVLDGADLPNLLFFGPPGTGKTSAAVALCRQLFRNTDTYRERVLEMNASDERGINIVRTKVKEFARQAVTTHLPDGSPVVGLKVIILDEADAMTSAAQAALRRTMERESRTTRFFLICNYISRIISPLTSRCAKFRFKPLSAESQRERLEYICNKENIEVTPTAIAHLIELSGGDLRKSITYLQTVSCCFEKVTPEDVQEMCGAVPGDMVTNLIEVSRSASFDELVNFAEGVIRSGFSVYQLLNQAFDVLLCYEDLLDMQKAIIFDKMAQCELCLVDGANEFLQLLDFCAVLQEQLKDAK